MLIILFVVTVAVLFKAPFFRLLEGEDRLEARQYVEDARQIKAAHPFLGGNPNQKVATQAVKQAHGNLNLQREPSH